MISMGKSGGVYGSGNTGLPQAFSGGRKTQNNQKSIFGAKNSQSGIFGQKSGNSMFATKSSVTDIRRMLSRDSQSAQMQAANRWSQDSIVTSSLSYSESLRNQRQQTKNTTLALKKLKYQFKNISSKILRSKTSQAAKQAAGQARREVLRLKRQKQSGNYDDDEIEAAINHAKAMERVAKKKAKHLEEEELTKAAGGIWQGEKVCTDEEERTSETDQNTDPEAEEELPCEATEAQSDMDLEKYDYPQLDEFLLQTSELMVEMSDFTSEMMQELSDGMRDIMEEMGMDELPDTMLSVKKDIDPADLKMMKIKHRNKEMKEIVKADAEYLKAVFDRLEKMKDNPVIPSGGGMSLSAGSTGMSFSADAAGIGVPTVPASVIDISL